MLQGKRGGLKDTLPDDMMEAVFRATIQRTGVNPAVSSSAPPMHQSLFIPLPSAIMVWLSRLHIYSSLTGGGSSLRASKQMLGMSRSS